MCVCVNESCVISLVGQRKIVNTVKTMEQDGRQKVCMYVHMYVCVYMRIFDYINNNYLY